MLVLQDHLTRLVDLTPRVFVNAVATVEVVSAVTTVEVIVADPASDEVVAVAAGTTFEARLELLKGHLPQRACVGENLSEHLASDLRIRSELAFHHHDGTVGDDGNDVDVPGLDGKLPNRHKGNTFRTR